MLLTAAVVTKLCTKLRFTAHVTETRQERGDDREDFGVEEYYARILADPVALAQVRRCFCAPL
jgi:hypothetical protein